MVAKYLERVHVQRHVLTIHRPNHIKPIVDFLTNPPVDEKMGGIVSYPGGNEKKKKGERKKEGGKFLSICDITGFLCILFLLSRINLRQSLFGPRTNQLCVS